jgi:hypothetical protein
MDENKTFLQQAKDGDLDPLQAIMYTAKALANLPTELSPGIRKRIAKLIENELEPIVQMAERARGIKVVPDFQE